MKIGKILYGFTILFLVSCNAFAKKDTIQFGDFFFTPNSMTITVGDTIEWVGDFTMHQIETTPTGSLPSGASSIGPSTFPSSMASFIYVVTVAGNYDYHCAIHPTLMIGSFTAVAAADVPQQTSNIFGTQNFPNPFKSNTVIRYSLINPAEVDLKIFDLFGNIIRHEAQGFQSSGIHEISLDVTGFTSGSYIYSLQAGEAILRERMILVH